MQIKLNGKTCTVTVVTNRLKAALWICIILATFFLPAYSCNQANVKLESLQLNPKTSSVSIQSPIISPYNLTPRTKTLLHNWLSYGYENGYIKI